MEKVKLLKIIAISSIIFLSLASHVKAEIGQVAEFEGKVQIRTVKAEKISVVVGSPINFGDMLKVRKKSIVHIGLVDESKFQIGQKTTVVFDDFIFDEKNQKLTARILDGVLTYDGEKMSVNSERKFLSNKYTLTVRGTKFGGKFGQKSEVVLLKGSISVDGNGQSQTASGPFKKLTFDASGIEPPVKITFDEAEEFFSDLGFDFEKLIGPNFRETINSGASAVN